MRLVIPCYGARTVPRIIVTVVKFRPNSSSVCRYPSHGLIVFITFEQGGLPNTNLTPLSRHDLVAARLTDAVPSRRHRAARAPLTKGVPLRLGVRLEDGILFVPPVLRFLSKAARRMPPLAAIGDTVLLRTLAIPMRFFPMPSPRQLSTTTQIIRHSLAPPTSLAPVQCLPRSGSTGYTCTKARGVPRRNIFTDQCVTKWWS